MGSEDHDCLRKEDIEDYYEFKEALLRFIGYKEASNGYVTSEFEKVYKRIDSVENKLDKLIFLFVMAAITTTASAILLILKG